MDLREKIIKAWKTKSYILDQLADTFSVNKSTVRRYIKKYKESKSLAPLPNNEGTVNSSIFLTWLEELLCPELKAGMTVIMDNLKSHKSDKVKELIESTGAELVYLPPYSPLLNPIEQAWSKVKNFLKRHTAKTERSLCNVIKKALNTVTKEDCFNWVRGCNYCIQ